MKKSFEDAYSVLNLVHILRMIMDAYSVLNLVHILRMIMAVMTTMKTAES